jgi:hypothetical protein
MKSVGLGEIKQFVMKTIESIDTEPPKGKLMNKAQKKNYTNIQKARIETLVPIIAKINQIESRE